MAEILDAETRQEIWDGVQTRPEASAFAWKDENPWLPLSAISNAKWVFRTLTESDTERPKEWLEAFALAKNTARQKATQRLSDENAGPVTDHVSYAAAAKRGTGREKRSGKTLTKRFLDTTTTNNNKP